MYALLGKSIVRLWVEIKASAGLTSLVDVPLVMPVFPFQARYGSGGCLRIYAFDTARGVLLRLLTSVYI
jgi:hypothetical protein